MRQPLWAINSSLLLFCILGQVVFLLLHAPIARRTSLEPDPLSTMDKKSYITVDIKKIYGVNDLFDTYTPMMAQAKTVEPEIPPIPNAPPLIPLSIPVETPKVFIPPLAVTLKGVMYAHDQPAQSVAIIQFQNSKEEMNYHVGQLINDAQILKIYPNRIIVVRSNGQKETLYLHENEATKDVAAQTAKEIATLHITIKNGVHQVPVQLFTKQVKGLGQFIDLLDLTTVYKKGKSVGCRVGKADKESLASKLGLQNDDIIEQIDNLPITDIASRVLAFDHVLTKNLGDVITVTLDRNGQRIQLKYELVQVAEQTPALTSAKSAKTPAPAPVITEQMLYDIEQKKKHMLEQKIKFAPTAQQLQAEERKKMFQARHKELITQKAGTVEPAGAKG
jgi:type II secretion system protein C